MQSKHTGERKLQLMSARSSPSVHVFRLCVCFLRPPINRALWLRANQRNRDPDQLAFEAKTRRVRARNDNQSFAFAKMHPHKWTPDLIRMPEREEAMLLYLVLVVESWQINSNFVAKLIRN